MSFDAIEDWEGLSVVHIKRDWRAFNGGKKRIGKGECVRAFMSHGNAWWKR
jgi:hypothetical protein